MNKKFTVHVVPSTHWDREWYITQRRFQVRLVRLMEKVMKRLENDEYKNFLLDGQTVPIEDYLEIMPQNREKLKKLIKENRLTVGPWYVVPDTLTPSGESMVRNLMIGKECLEEFDGQNSVGYSPDIFGVASQVPQVLSLFGYKYIQTSRGENTPDGKFHAEVNFASPDGTALLSLFDGYASGISLSYESVWKNMTIQKVCAKDIYEQTSQMLEEHEKLGYFLGKNRILIVGVDHVEPNSNLTEVIKELSVLSPDTEFIHSTQDDYFAALEKELKNTELCTVTGEQIGGYKGHFVIGNTISTRPDIKLLNRKAENMLEKYTAPLNAFVQGLDSFYEFDADKTIDCAWRELVKNHAHDSICACSVDDVTEDIKVRLRDVCDMSGDIKNYKFRTLAQNIAKNELSPAPVVVFNPLPYERDAYIDEIVRIPYDMGEGSFVLTDENGKEMEHSEACIITKKRFDIETEKVTDEVVMNDETRSMFFGEEKDTYSFVRVSFSAKKLPACGYTCFYLKKSDKKTACKLKYSEKSCENDVIAVAFNKNGSFDMTDKQTGKIYQNQNLFEEIADFGDTYTFSPNSEPVFTDVAEVFVSDTGAEFVEFTVKTVTAFNTAVESKIKVGMTDLVEITTTVENKEYNHRLRARFDAPCAVDEAMSDTAFDMVKRPVYKKSERTKESIFTYPLRNVLSMGNLVIFSKSSQEYECMSDGDISSAYLTVLRSIESVYKTVTATKNESFCGHGSRWFTDGAKMIGTYTFSYAVKPCASNKKPEIYKMAEEYQYTPALISDIADGTLPQTHSYSSLSGCQLSTVIKNNDGEEFHVFNMEDKDISCELTISEPFKKVFLTDFAMKEKTSLEVSGNIIKFSLRHNQIANIVVIK